ncbi:MAG: glutamate-5-semialdehyde dehydrogenase [Clostridia bacterium]|nr:glutamate-5-semialdehyde dehydrogenase [Clostridia bacterium]
MTDNTAYIVDICRRAKEASKVLASVPSSLKNRALLAVAEKLVARTDMILEANAADLAAAAENGMKTHMLDRLRLTEKRILDMSEGVRQVAALPDPVGETLWETVRPNGMEIVKKRVPLGVIGIIFESRPNVTCDCSALTLKSGNAAVLRGGKEAVNSNKAIADVFREGLLETGLPEDSVVFVERTDRAIVNELFRMREYIDVLIPRGGKGLIANVVENSKVPVIRTGEGNCHTYIDDVFDRNIAVPVVVNAKTQRPSVCNAMETLLVSEKAAPEILPVLAEELASRGVELRTCEKSREILKRCAPSIAAVLATESDYATEYDDLILAVKVVEDVEEAIEHINRYGTGHSEAIITNDCAHAEEFRKRVDAACVYVNCSTRFTDGFEFGFGAEIGISNQKLHARGPMGLNELTSYKYIINGNGQTRE